MQCVNCQGSSGATVMGNCSSCGADISNGTDKYCSKCSKLKGRCRTCGKPLGGHKPGTVRPLGQ